MNQDQMEKQLEWLDKERREDKKTITALQKKVAELEGLIEKTNAYIQSLDSELTKTGVRLTKMDSYDEALAAHRKEVKKELDAQEKRAKSRETTVRNKLDSQTADLSAGLAALKEKTTEIPKLREAIEANQKAGLKQDQAINDLNERVKRFSTRDDELAQSVRILEEDLTADKKRLADAQGELSALRKRIDEQRAQFELAAETQKKADTRLNELIASEDSRREKQREFLEEISRSKLEIEKAYKEWSGQFALIEERAETLTSALQTYREIEGSLKKAQSEFESITEQISRRIHEITEIQRLGEERFRQEWTTFKSDDQKRWVNYTLTQEEQAKEAARRYERLNGRLTTLEELFQDMQDAVEQSSEQMDSLMQGLMGVFREWLSTNERFSDNR